MSIGILLITHSGIGSALLNVVYSAFERPPLEITHLSVSRNPDPNMLITQADTLVRKIDSGKGVLVLTDLYGATPSNVAQNLQKKGHLVQVISGVNLPMLFKILNYPDLELKQLAKKAVQGGMEGIFETFNVCNKMISSSKLEEVRKKKHNKLTAHPIN